MIGNGRIVSQGAKSELLHAGGTVVRSTDPGLLRRALAELGIATRSDDDALHTDADRVLVGKVAFEAGVALTELRAEDAGLEDMFLELTATSQREGAMK
jgi:ABC-2 type transport system ATP-binding protein